MVEKTLWSFLYISRPARLAMIDLRAVLAFGILLCLVPAFADPSGRHRRATALSLSTSSFGTSLYKRLASVNHDNIIYSPLSAYAALSMTLLGAGGDTERELRTALAVPEEENIHARLYDLMTSIATHDKTLNVTLHMADAVYYDPQQVQVSDSYAANMRQYYGAGLKPFQRPNPEQAINTWVEEVTERAITDFLQPGDITSDTVLMLLNAVFFEASWQTVFDPRETHQSAFTTLSGAVKQVSMMNQEGSFAVKDVPQLSARILELPYKGRRYSFFIILPNAKNGLTQLEGQISGPVLENILAIMPNPTHFDLYLPKFTLRMRKGLKESLQALGLKSMFEGTANFTGMARATGDRTLVVSDVQQEAMIEVTESGTKAAAVTSVSVQVDSVPQSLRVDHPCLFLLRDKADGVNLFMGRLTDPSQAGH